MTTRSGTPFWEAFYDAFFNDPIYQAFYGHSGFANFGYWQPGTADAATASKALVHLVARQIDRPGGSLLDVGCGVGATTNELAQWFDPVVGINLDEVQIAEARKRHPHARFETMSATQLGFADRSFDHVIAVEAAFHFNTRAQFFAEALRVLKPGGQLVMSDLLMARGAPLSPATNHVSGIDAYRSQLSRAGFHDVAVSDITGPTWHAYRRKFTQFAAQRPERWLSLGGLRDLYTLNVNSAWAIRKCVLVSARKPG